MKMVVAKVDAELWMKKVKRNKQRGSYNMHIPRQTVTNLLEEVIESRRVLHNVRVRLGETNFLKLSK